MIEYQTATEFVYCKPEDIQIAEPPDPTSKDYDPDVYKFSNPRGRAKGGGFDREPMAELEKSIIKNGLQLPLLLRKLGDDTLQLIAGERRLQAIKNIKKKSKKKPLLVHNIQTNEKEPADKVYETIFVRITECDDETALSLAVDENEQSQPLTVADQVRLVEGLLKTGMKPTVICRNLNKNAAWVNHTQHFRDQLPEDCFSALMNGEINRHVATELMRYPTEVRSELWGDCQAVLKGKIESKRKELDSKLEVAAGEKEIADASKEMAGELGLNEKEAESKAASAGKKLEKAKDDKEEFENNPPTLTGGDVSTAAVNTNKKAKTPQAFNKRKIEEYYIDPLMAALEMDTRGGDPGEKVRKKDEVTGRYYPKQVLFAALQVCEGIVNQDKDVFEVIREYMFDIGKWERPEEEEYEDEEEYEEEEEEYEDESAA